MWIAIVVVIAALTLLAWRASRRRTDTLRERLGSASHRAGEGRREGSAAPDDLATRMQQRERLEIRPLADAERRGYAERWQRTQATFGESPEVSVAEADALVRAAMVDRGYPVTDDDRRLADLAVDHPDVIDRFRLATAIAVEAREERATPERLRQAMVHYRELVGALLGEDEAAADGG
jgi:hypothetical protein